MKLAMLMAIQECGSYVSFAEIHRRLEEKIKGDLCICMDEPYQNIIIWDGWNEEACKTFWSLKTEKLITIHGASLLIYAIDGMLPKMPIAKNMKQYKKPHWLPVTFTITEAGKGLIKNEEIK